MRNAAAVRRDPAEVLRGRDIVCFSNDWHGDPLSKTHLMRILARDNRVLWVNSLGLRAPTASKADFARLVDKLARAAGGLREVEKNLHVLSPLAIPAYVSRLARAANGELLRAQLKFAMRRLGFRRPLSWSFLPSAAPVAGRLGEERVIYHCVDEFSAFTGNEKHAILELEERLCRRADLVIASAERLVAAKRGWNPATVLVRHGVDHTHFARALAPETKVAPELEHLSRPVLGFFGLIADWVDLKLLRAVADRMPEATLVLVGKAATSLAPLDGARNVLVLGRRPYESLPSLCKGFDVALMPFVVNELTLASNPLKVREYLAAGLPVVSTPIPEVQSVGLCRIADGADAWVAAIRAQLAEGCGPSRARSQAIAHESWEARVDEIRAHLAERGLA